MRKAIVILILLAVGFVPGIGFAQKQASAVHTTTPGATKLYITSFYDVAVYRSDGKVLTLPSGVKAQILGTVNKWILVKFRRGSATVTGWIRR